MLTYLLLITCWMSLALGVLAPWLVDLLAPHGNFARSAEAVPLLCFATAAYSGYTRARDRHRPRAADAVQLGRQPARRALVNIALNVALIPRYGMMGAAVATLVAYVALFVGMWLNSRRVYPVPYQWRRVITLAARRRRRSPRSAGAIGSLPVAIVLIARLPARAAAAALLPARRARPPALAPADRASAVEERRRRPAASPPQRIAPG